MWWVILALLIFFLFQDIYKIFKVKLPERTNVARSIVKSYFLIILIALFIRTFLIQAYMIPSGSMEDTLKRGDFLLVLKFVYGIRIPFTEVRILNFHKPQRQEIIVFEAPPAALYPDIPPDGPQKDYIKRCIGLPEELIDIKGKEIYINGKLLEEHYTAFKPSIYNSENDALHFEIPKNCYLMLGDNRNNSHDGRRWGFLSYSYIKGKAFILYFPINRIKIIK